VTATFATGAAGNGIVQLKACDNALCSQGFDYGNYNVTMTIVSLAVMNSGTRGVDPFDVVTTHTTPAYQSLGVPKAITLVYNSSTVKPTPVVQINVRESGSPYPTHYSMQVKLNPSGVRLHLLNGTDSVFYVAGTSDTSRLVAAIDAQANALTTGWYEVNVVVTSYYASSVKSTTVPARLLVDDESTSLFGAGWQIGGIQRLYTSSGYSALITNGDGSMSFFRRDCSNCAFISPAGDPTALVAVGALYERRAPDSSAVMFGSDGRMTGLWSGALHHTVVTLTWSGTQLTSVQDYIGKRFVLGYTGSYSQSGKLQTITDPAGRVTIVWTDAGGKVYKITDPDNLFTTFAYDASLRLTGITDRGSATTNLTYDALSRLDSTKAPSIIDYNGLSVRPTITTLSPVRLVWQPTISGTTIGTAKARVRSDTVYGNFVSPVGSVTRVAYDRFAALTKVIDPLGQTTTITRDTLGQATSIVSPNGHTVSNTFNGYFLASTSDNATGQTVFFDYYVGKLGTIRGQPPFIDFYYYPSYPNGPQNGLIRSVRVGNTGTHNNPFGGVVADSFVYGAWGVDSLAIDGAGHVTKILYSDTANFRNRAQVFDPFGRLVSKAHYDLAGRPDTVWTPSNFALVKSVMTYDSLNRVRTIKDPLGFTTLNTYGPMTLNRLTDPKGRVYKFAYNALGWLVAQHDLADTTKADTLKYDAAGRVRTVRTRRAHTISLTYDAVGRQLTRSGPDFPVDSFRYDPAGRWLVGTNTNAYDSLAFDQAGRLTYSLERLTNDSTYVMTYSYDTNGRLQTRSAPRLGSQARYVYGGSGAVDTLCTAGSCIAFGARDADNLAHSVTFGSTTAHGWVLNLKTDSMHRLVSDSFTPRVGGYSVAHLNPEFAKSFYYDTLSRLTTEWPYGSQYGYGGYLYRYDADGRIVNACLDQTTYVQPIGVVFSCIDEYGQETHPLVSSTKSYSYDSTGNRTDPMANPVIGPGNRVTQFKGYTIAYDFSGNILSKKGADTTLLTWDAASVLKQVERWTPGAAHTVVTYAYDALGRRVAKTVSGVVERYVHDGSQVILDVYGTSTLKTEYGWAPGVDNLMYVRTPTWTAAAIRDPMVGTIRGLAQVEWGTTYKQYPASYWGQVGTDTGFVLRHRLAGREYDQEVRLYYNRARYYDPQLGRFLSEDPIGIAGGINLYAYSGNDPVNNADPTGLCHWGDGVPDPHPEFPKALPEVCVYGKPYEENQSGMGSYGPGGDMNPVDQRGGGPPNLLGRVASDALPLRVTIPNPFIDQWVEDCHKASTIFMTSGTLDAFALVGGLGIVVRWGMKARAATGIVFAGVRNPYGSRMLAEAGGRLLSEGTEWGFETAYGGVFGGTVASRLSNEPDVRDYIPIVATDKAYNDMQRVCP
jgi:RHS repeat-associated protein